VLRSPRVHVLTAPQTLRYITWAAAATVAAVVAFTGTAGVARSMTAAAIAGLLAAAVTLGWIRRQPIEAAAAQAPRAVRVAFLTGTLLVGVQLMWLVPFILDPTRSSWGPGVTAPLPSTHSCVSAYWIADVSVSRVPDLYDESLSSIPQRDPAARRVPRTMGPFNIDAFEYPPTFLPLPRLLRLAAPDFWDFRQLWFALNFGVVLWIAVVIGLRLDRAAGTHSVWLVPFVVAAPPIISTFQAGNIQMAIVAASAAALLLFERRAYVAGGAVLAYVIAAKIYPGALVFYLLLRRDWRAIAWTAGFGGLIVLTSLAAFGWTPFAAFIDHAPKLMSGEAFPAFRNPLAIANNGSVPGLVFKLGLFGVPNMGFEAMRIVGWLYTLVVIGGIAWLAMRARPQGREPLVWLAILVLATMRSPFLPTYAAFPTSWLAIFAAALAWRDARAVWPYAACWLLLAVGFGPGGIEPLAGAAWTTFQTMLAFALLVVVMRQLRAPSHPAPAAATASAGT
jgi:alpha-1,2-mannosyltransferase